jgi:hypothetical protein
MVYLSALPIFTLPVASSTIILSLYWLILNKLIKMSPKPQPFDRLVVAPFREPEGTKIPRCGDTVMCIAADIVP